MILAKTIKTIIDGENGKVFVDQETLKNAHHNFLNRTHKNSKDSYNLGDFYILGEEDAKVIRDLDDQDINKQKFQQEVLTRPQITTHLAWWKEASRVLKRNLFDVDIEKIASKGLTENDFMFSSFTEKERENLKIEKDIANKYIDDFNKETNKERKQKMLNSIKVLLPNAYKHTQIAVLSYYDISKLMSYAKTQKDSEWKEFLECVQKFDNYNELIAPKNEQKKSRKEMLEEEEIEKLILDTKRREEKAKQRKENFERMKQNAKEKWGEWKQKVAIWEIKAIFKAYDFSQTLKNKAKTAVNGAKRVISVVKEKVQTKQDKNERTM